MNERVVPVGWLVALGALWSVVLGAVVVLVARRPTSPLAGLPPINIWNGFGHSPNMLAAPMGPVPAAMPVMLTPQVDTFPSRLSTYTLQTDRASRIMTAAGANFWRVQLRTIGPPGAIARVATEVNALAFPTMSIAVPAGDATELRVRPGDALFAIGNIANVELSVSATEDLT